MHYRLSNENYESIFLRVNIYLVLSIKQKHVIAFWIGEKVPIFCRKYFSSEKCENCWVFLPKKMVLMRQNCIIRGSLEGPLSDKTDPHGVPSNLLDVYIWKVQSTFWILGSVNAQFTFCLTLLWDILWISQIPPPFNCCYWGSHVQRGVLSLSSKTLQKISTSRVLPFLSNMRNNEHMY